MRKVMICASLVMLVAGYANVVAGSPATEQQSQGKLTLTLEDIFASDKFLEQSLNGAKWMPDSRAFSYLKASDTGSLVDLYRHDVTTGAESLLVAGDKLRVSDSAAPLMIDDYSWSGDGRSVLVQCDTKHIWRFSRESRYYLYELSSRSLRAVTPDESRASAAQLAPDGSQVGYVSGNNLFTRELPTGRTQQWTQDGSAEIINGQFDWVYEEEFNPPHGWEWSPDGKRIAFWRFDQSPVREFSWVEYDSTYPQIRTIRYPKAGEKNALVKIGIINLADSTTVWVRLGDDSDVYIPRIKWTNDPNRLSVQRLNRRQNRLELLLADAHSGQAEVILTDSDACWVDVHDNLFFLKDNDRFIWTSERSGFNHIYLFDNRGNLVRQLTDGPWEVGTVYGVDETAGTVLFSSNRAGVTQCNLYACDLSTGSERRLTDLDGWESADFSPDFRHFLDYFSNLRTPEQVHLFAADGTRHEVIVENEFPALADYAIRYPEMLTFRTADSELLYAWILKPLDFDQKHNYPVLVPCYGMPGSQSVTDKWALESLLWYNYLTQHGYIVFRVDNRTAGGRGKALKNLGYGDMGKWAVEDEVQGALYLASLPYVDSSRIGIWGWSGGGYTTLMTMTRGAGYFKAGAAVAPVADWKLYDDIYTERYMGLPSENPAGYDSASVLTHADQLKGKLLIVHGTSDENVHVQNTMRMAAALQALDRQFELMLYPGKNHSVPGLHAHVFRLITEFILRNL